MPGVPYSARLRSQRSQSAAGRVTISSVRGARLDELGTTHVPLQQLQQQQSPPTHVVEWALAMGHAVEENHLLELTLTWNYSMFRQLAQWNQHVHRQWSGYS